MSALTTSLTDAQKQLLYQAIIASAPAGKNQISYIVDLLSSQAADRMAALQAALTALKAQQQATTAKALTDLTAIGAVFGIVL